jgi:acetyltransferase-like isoleucine patch superfamily enzyme
MIDVSGEFIIGDYGHMGVDYWIRGHNVTIGDHFYHSKGLRVGGGGHKGPNANLTIGDRCTLHNNFINVCEEVNIGNDVGLSEEVSIITHGYWQSVLDGYPRKFAPVTIGDNVIIGYRSIILPGVEISDGCVVGAGSVVVKSLNSHGVYAGNPAKFIRNIEMPTEVERQRMALKIMREYRVYAEYFGHSPSIEFRWPKVIVDDFTVNLLTFEYFGIESPTTDHFRDYMRKWGIRIYTERAF